MSSVRRSTITVIQWKDASYVDHDDGNNDGLFELVSAGILVKETEEYITIALDDFEDDSNRHLISIPQAWIVNRQDRVVRWK
ncbi:hypothetical protein LCGC14_2804450 [marine sediment metagenome]|uniref:Uncharacterized protein n=1 Tax=marine sediment metagenome TaxID=412755 RepID=A0A0F9BD23_9ZZZZ